MGRSAKSFERRKPQFKPRPTVLVVCEDSKSAKRYLEDATYHFRINVTVEISHCGRTDPKGIVANAIERSAKFDRVFCAIDRDTHESFEAAIATADAAEKVTVIASYPCFEFWYLLHFDYSRKPYRTAGNESAGDRLGADLRACEGMERYDKGAKKSVFDLLLDKLPVARHTASRVFQHAVDTKEMNPSTQVHTLIDFFEDLSELKSN
ncbi:MAG TPA: RloB family protein [Herbaspirillum sp.]|jgi:hypothetical protein|nr:RloB family protein [Herbaspirillum sp.]